MASKLSGHGEIRCKPKLRITHNRKVVSPIGVLAVTVMTSLTVVQLFYEDFVPEYCLAVTITARHILYLGKMRSRTEDGLGPNSVFSAMASQNETHV
jgi:hypothetical protein